MWQKQVGVTNTGFPDTWDKEETMMKTDMARHYDDVSDDKYGYIWNMMNDGTSQIL